MFKNKLIINCHEHYFDFVTSILEKMGYVAKGAYASHLMYTYVIVDNTGIYELLCNLEDKHKNGEYFNCGHNKELFLGLAAMRDDNDAYQLFASDVECHWINQGMWREKGDFELSLIPDYNEHNKYSSSAPHAHKASVEEIKNYFMLNPDYCPYHTYYQDIVPFRIFDELASKVRQYATFNVYTITANQETFKHLKRKAIAITNGINEQSFVIDFNSMLINVKLDTVTTHKMVLWKNGVKYFVVDTNNNILKVKEYDGN